MATFPQHAVQSFLVAREVLGITEPIQLAALTFVGQVHDNIPLVAYWLQKDTRYGKVYRWTHDTNYWYALPALCSVFLWRFGAINESLFIFLMAMTIVLVFHQLVDVAWHRSQEDGGGWREWGVMLEMVLWSVQIVYLRNEIATLATWN